MYLIDHSRKIKTHHLNRGKLHLNKKGSTVLSNTFITDIFRAFNRQFKNNSGRNFKKCNSDISLDVVQLSSCDKTLKSTGNDSVNKFIFCLFEHKYHHKQI